MVLGPQLGATVYISKLNETKKIKSDEQVVMNKNSPLVDFLFVRGGWRRQCPQLKIISNFWNCPKWVELAHIRTAR